MRLGAEMHTSGNTKQSLITKLFKTVEEIVDICNSQPSITSCSSIAHPDTNFFRNPSLRETPRIFNFLREGSEIIRDLKFSDLMS
jgi:hypothetical protein